ncbi:MAG: type II toxin-antitoxin system VapC family toxin [Actinobacteria bacterium]|nr:type II toxin-antitoxin system VapC family toxin [Actinomycetota bacterium]
MVLDASVVVELLLNTVRGNVAAKRLNEADVTLHAPHLVGVEVTQAVRRYVRTGTLPQERGRLALVHLAELDLRRYPHEPLLPRIWSLRENLTAYDAAYVSLAEALDAPLWTFDSALESVPGSVAVVEVLAT